MIMDKQVKRFLIILYTISFLLAFIPLGYTYSIRLVIICSFFTGGILLGMIISILWAFVKDGTEGIKEMLQIIKETLFG